MSSQTSAVGALLPGGQFKLTLWEQENFQGKRCELTTECPGVTERPIEHVRSIKVERGAYVSHPSPPCRSLGHIVLSVLFCYYDYLPRKNLRVARPPHLRLALVATYGVKEVQHPYITAALFLAPENAECNLQRKRHAKLSTFWIAFQHFSELMKNTFFGKLVFAHVATGFDWPCRVEEGYSSRLT